MRQGLYLKHNMLNSRTPFYWISRNCKHTFLCMYLRLHCMHHCEDIHCFYYSTMPLPLFVIVIARGQGFRAVNKPSTRAKPEDKVCLRCHKSLATLLYIPPDWYEFRILGDTIFKFSIATIATVLFFHSTVVVATEMACLFL